MKVKAFFFFVLLPFLFMTAQDSTQVFIDLGPTGVNDFLEAHPEYNGKGTIIFIFDTGVDMGIEGLTKTPDGEPKVIDARDFTGQGDVPYYEADTDEEDGKEYFVNEDHELKVEGAGKLAYEAIGGDYYIGALTEEMFKNSASGATDLNGDGDKTDKFHFVTFKTGTEDSSYMVAFFDTDGDGSLADEIAFKDYHVAQQSFTVESSAGLAPLTFAINIMPEENVVNFHFDDGAHGTHCAGIAAGYRIGDNDFNGVAPGSKVISCKLGNNNYAGGATVSESMKKSFLFADSLSKALEEPCIINMSFGIGSEIEGRSDMERFLDKLVDENPYLYICTSNGNEGPGISTSGLPAASDHVFSSGAVLTKDVGSNLYGTSLDHDIVLYFSSRGGEVNKPDVVSPGAATSTVPAWGSWDRFWGTSMASPYSAGVMSLLLSGLHQEFPDVKVPSMMLYKIIKQAAVPFEWYDHVDQGSGYINVQRAWELLKKYAQNGEIKNYETYNIMSTAPNMPRDVAQSLYLRDGSFLNGKEVFTFSVSRNNFLNKDQFYRLYTIKSEADWLKPKQTQTYIRNNQPTMINVSLDADKMKEPGLYNGIVKGFRKGTDIVEFELMATVVMPYNFDSGNDYRQSWESRVAPGMFDRYFVRVPGGASSMIVRLMSEEGEYTRSRFFVHAPDGEQIIRGATLDSFEEEDSVEKIFYDLEPGVYEVVTAGHFMARDTSSYKLEIEFTGIENITDNNITPEDNEIVLYNSFNKQKEYTPEVEILGYVNEYDIDMDTDKYLLDFVMRKGEENKTFEIEISRETFNKMTDFAIMIYDEDGNALSSGGLSYRSGEISIDNTFPSDSVNLQLALLPGFSNEPVPINVKVTETTLFDNEYDVKVKTDSRRGLTLFPSVTETLNLEYSKPDKYFPPESKPYGKLYLKAGEYDVTEVEIPLFFKF